MTPEQRRLRARTAIHTRWARTTDRAAATQPARDAFFRRFEDEVDPDRQLDPSERQIRAQHALRAYMSKMAYERERARQAGAS